MERIKNDERFAHIASDSRFRKISKNERKVKIDKRFRSMFTDGRFKLRYSVDKRGRPQNGSTNENLKKYYDLTSTDEEEEEDEEDSPKNLENEILLAKNRNVQLQKSPYESAESSNENEAVEEEEVTADLARGEGNVESSTSEEESSEDEDDGLVHPWGELGVDAPEASQVTHRLAVCNMDWDRLSAQDLYVLLNSFTPPGGVIISVKIYLSDFGRERLKEEDLYGPKELREPAENDNNASSSNQAVDGEAFHMEKLRKYQLNRLKYYYAIVECSTAEVANKIYEECDGLEYESSAARLDLRFVPDEMAFEEEPHSVANTSSEPNVFRPKIFKTTALQQSKVRLTWDETNPDRVQMIHRAFKDEDEQTNDLRAYLASSDSEEASVDEDKAINQSESESDNDTNENRIGKYRELLQEMEQEKEKKEHRDVELEISWGPGLKQKAESIIQQKQQEKECSPWEQYLLKKKEKRKEKKEEKKSLNNVDKNENSESDDQNPYSDDELPSDVDINDDFFKQNLVATNSGKKNMKKQIAETTPADLNKGELELLLMDEDDGKHHFSLRKIIENESKKQKKKRKEKPANSDEDAFQMNLQDPRFSAVFSSHLYNIDPSEPQFKKTKGMEAMIQERQRRLELKSGKGSTDKEKVVEKKFVPSKQAELSSLVKSIKSKVSNLDKRKK